MSDVLLAFGFYVAALLGYIFGWVIGDRHGRQSVVDAHNRNQEIAREAAKDPQVQAALDER